MSVGAEPLTDDELARLQQLAVINPPEDLGPPAPMPGDSVINPVLDQPLPANASPGVVTDDAAWPPPVPAEAPGMVPPATPTPVPPPSGAVATGAPPAPIVAPLDGPGRLAQADADIRDAATGAGKARQASDAAQLEAVQGGADLAHQNAEIESQRRIDQQIEQNEREEAQKRYDAADKSAQTKVDEAANARKNFKFRDYWANKSMGLKIASSLAVALGAYGAGLTKGPNYALQILDKDMDDDHRMQVEEAQQLTDDEVRARTGLKDVAEARKQDLLNRQMNSALGDQLIATQLKEAAAKSTDANYQKNVNAFAAKLQEDSAQKLLEARTAVRNGIIKEQDETAKAAERAALANLHNAQANAGGYARVARGHSGGGGGTGGVSRVGANAEELAKRIREGNNGKPLTDDEIIHAATELHIPLAGKAGVTTLQTVRNVAKFDADSAAKARKTGIQNERLDEGRFKDFEKEHGLPKLEFTQHKLTEVLKKLDTGNPVGAMSSLMEFDAAAKGGNATEASMHAIQGRLGGTWTRIKGAVEKGESGNFAPEELANLRGAVKDALGGNKETIDKVHTAFGKQFDYSNPLVKQRAAGMFGPLGYESAGGGGHAAPHAAPAAGGVRKRLKDGRTGTLMPDGSFIQD